MESRFDPAAAPPDPPALLAYVSRLLGADEDLVLAGGGNTSWKGEETDALGRPARILRVKASGSDMARIGPDGFAALRLDDLLPLQARDDLSDEGMVDFALRAMTDPRQRRPSIEVLLHAFLPDAWVLHSHADALLALCNRRDGDARVRDALGDGVARVPYRRPGFRLAMEVARVRREGAAAVVLMKHGLVTFGATAREAYESHIAVVTRCERALPPAPAPPRAGPAHDRAAAWAPRIRGALGAPRVLRFDGSAEVLDFLRNPEWVEAYLRGPATADHVLRTGRRPCVAHGVEDVARWREEYLRYAESGDREGLPVGDPAPKVVLVPEVGMWAETALALDIVRHTMRIVRKAGSAWEPIPPEEQFRAEFWPLEKRKAEGARGQLAGRVAWVSGAASGIGRAIARRFAEEGAHLLLADVDGEGVEAVASGIGAAAAAHRCDVTSEADVRESFRRAVLAYGGVDVVVSNAGVASPAPVEELSREEWERSLAVNATSHFLVAKAAMPVLRAQGLGGSIVFTASKNVLAPGKGFAAYSAAKAAEAQLARVLALEAAEIGVRVNTLHPDAVFQGTRLWSDEVRRERARAHGVAVGDLEDFYAKRNLLRRPVRPEDVAEAALFFASDRSSRTTGAFLTIDGGVKEAFPR